MNYIKYETKNLCPYNMGSDVGFTSIPAHIGSTYCTKRCIHGGHYKDGHKFHEIIKCNKGNILGRQCKSFKLRK